MGSCARGEVRITAVEPGLSASCRRSALWLCALAFSGCAGSGSGTPTPILGTAPDAEQRYERCSDREGMLAYDSAVKRVGERQPLQALPLLRTAIARCPEFLRAHVLY